MNNRSLSAPLGKFLRFVSYRDILIAGLLVITPAAAKQIDSALIHEFVGRFQMAFENHDPQQAQDLFHWEGVTLADKNRIMLMIEHDVNSQLTSVQVLGPDNTVSPHLTNLPVVARLLVKFVNDQGLTHYSLHEIGVLEGRLFIALVPSEKDIQHSI